MSILYTNLYYKIRQFFSFTYLDMSVINSFKSLGVVPTFTTFNVKHKIVDLSSLQNSSKILKRSYNLK